MIPIENDFKGHPNDLVVGGVNIDPIALGTAKTLWSFCRPECNRVKSCIDSPTTLVLQDSASDFMLLLLHVITIILSNTSASYHMVTVWL